MIRDLKLLSVFLFLFTLMPITAQADSSERSSELRWAADASAGAPYMFVDPNDPKKFQGFEFDLMTKIAEILGKRLVFVQNEWDSLIPGLERGDYDVAANGIEITPDREREVHFSTPYYITFEQIIVSSNNSTIHELLDLNQKKVGTLKASLAHYILEHETKAKVIFYEEETTGYHDVASGRIDSFFVDYPIALYYALNNPKLKAVGAPIGTLRYGIAVSKKKPELLAQINEAIQKIKESGDLALILSKWNLLHPEAVARLGLRSGLENDSKELNKVSQVQNQNLTLSERLTRYKKLFPLLVTGAIRSLQISIVSMLVAIAFGLTLALMRLYGTRTLSLTAQSVIEILRGTPLLIQLYLIFFGLPNIGINLSPFAAAVLGLGFNYGAYEAENYRAGIEAVPKSQLEAAHALALSPFQRFVYVIFPQAYRMILPPMTNDFISLIKDSSLVSVITMVELTTIYSQLATTYFDHLGLGIVVAILYFVMGYPFVRLARRLEMNLKKKLR